MSWNEYYKEIQESYHIEDDTTVIKVPLDHIVVITSEELIFKNNFGETERINLVECAKNFDLAQGISTEQRAGRLQCVGGRRFPFFELFTPNHHTRLFIPLKTTAVKRFLKKIGWNPYSKEYSAFFAFQRKLNALGFTTLDLT